MMKNNEIVAELKRIKRGIGLCESINDFADVEIDIGILIARIEDKS